MKKNTQNVAGIKTEVVGFVWSDDYSPIFEPNHKNLYKLHKVPNFKRRFATD